MWYVNSFLILSTYMVPVLFFAGCSRFETIVEKDELGQIATYKVDKDTRLKQGKYTRTDEKGTILEEADYQEGELHGRRTLFFENGGPEIIETYQEGSFEGPYEKYYPNGQLEQSGVYSNNTMEGEWKKYYETGELMEIVVFKENVENGPFIEYYKNGKLKAEGSYRDGPFEDGRLKIYTEDGRLERVMECEIGKCRTIIGEKTNAN